MKHTRGGSALLLTALVTLALAACADEAPPSVDDDASVSAASPSTPPATENADDVQPAEDEAPADAPSSSPSSPGECLVGEWLADNDLFLAQMREFGDQMQDVTGEVILHFAAGGELTTRYEDWSMTAISEGVEMTIHRSGVDEGNYTVNGDTISVEDTNVGSTVSMSGAGINMAVPAEPVHFEDAPFTCAGDAATVTTAEGVMQLERR